MSDLNNLSPEDETPPPLEIEEVSRLAQNLARNRGYAVFSCVSAPDNKAADKLPVWPKREGGQGFKDASADPERVAWLWNHYPGGLIGVATGAVSNLWVLDVDIKHPEACDWWHANHHRLLPTRAYETRSGGVHLHFTEGEGIGCTASRLCKGVDTRSDGGYVIFWFAAGLCCHDPSPPAPWPGWLREALTPPPEAHQPYSGPPPSEAGIEGIVRRVAVAPEGERNGVLFWAACKLIERGVSTGEVTSLLLLAARQAGLRDKEINATIRSARERAA
jgi:hypothetical protein